MIRQNPMPAVGGERRFPDRPWDVLEPDALANAEARLEEASRAAVERSRPPCDLALARRHLEDHLPSGNCWIYACSSHTRSIIDILENKDSVRLLGCVDRNAAKIREFLGHPVVTPQECLETEFDYVLVGHAQNEAAFVDDLLDIGFDKRKIVCLYGDKIYWETAVHEYVERGIRRFPGPYRNVIVTDHAVVADDVDLLNVFRKEDTIVIYYGIPGKYDSKEFDLFDVNRSIDLMKNILSVYKPNNIYLRTFFDENFIANTLRTEFPDAVLVHEMFDMSIVFPDVVLNTWNKWSSEKIALLRLAEWNSFRTSDFIVSKRGGRCWERISSISGNKTATVFSRIVEPDQEPDNTISPTQPIRIVYAGYLPPNPKHVGGYYDLYPCFETLTVGGDIVVDIHNAGHREADDDIYGVYLNRQYEGRINYHKSSKYHDLLIKLQNYHYGWLYNERSDVYIYDAAVTIPGRVTGYISANLPVIIDDEFEFMADLIRDFNAGIIVPGGRSDLIPSLLKSADYAALRQGVRRLRAHMLEQNRSAFRRLRELTRR